VQVTAAKKRTVLRYETSARVASKQSRQFQEPLWIDKTAFSELLTAVTQYTVKHDTVMPCNIAQGTTDGNAQVPGDGKTTWGFEILYWDITTDAGENIPETCSAIFHALRGQNLKVTHIFCSKLGKSGGPWGSMPPATYITFQRATLI
jgi:D-alanyl-D-alanine carboxypeptidase